MKIRMIGSAIVATSILLTSCDGDPDATDQRAAVEAFVAAYESRDIDALLPLLSEDFRSTVEASIERNGREKQFSADMIDLLRAGRIEGPRYGQDGLPRYKLANGSSPESLPSGVQLIEVNDRWLISNVGQMTAFDELPEKKPAP